MPANQYQAQNPVEAYLNLDLAASRIEYLGKVAASGHTLPASLVSDLLSGRYAPAEHLALIAVCDTSEKLAFEDMITRGIYQWDQNVSSLALRLWAQKTDCMLWNRTLPLALDEHILQRVTYTLLDLAWYGAGRQLLEHLIKKQGIREMSPAFWALFYNRSIIWNFEDESLVEIGLQQLHSMNDVGFLGDRIIPHIVAYFLKFHPEILKDTNTKLQITGTWGDIIKSLQQLKIDGRYVKRYAAIVKSCQQDPKKLADFYTNWPSAWHRQQLPVELIKDVLVVVGTYQLHQTPNTTPFYEMLGGIHSAKLKDALLGLEDNRHFSHCLKVIGNLIQPLDERPIIEDLKRRLAVAENPLEVLEILPQKIRIRLGESQAGIFRDIYQESLGIQQAVHADFPQKLFTFEQRFSTDQEGLDRRNFIQARIDVRRVTPVITSSYWATLMDCWQNPDERKLDELASQSRQAPAAYKIFYIETLGRFQGSDKAALRLLDFVRSPDAVIIAAVIQSLAGIGTQRALQEIVSFLTRPNVTFDMQMDIAQILREKDLSNLQSEIRSAISDVHVDSRFEHLQWELKATLSDLLSAPLTVSSMPSSANLPAVSVPTSTELDQRLSKKFKDYHKLSSEAKRALRTAQFFHIQVESAGGLQTIDLSPAIDMQYKALELSFRECFEGPCNVLINTGILQRKLDVIGYARPIRLAMDKFEDYIEGLPTIKDIPFFSRFKLRKMLRALCQYRKGKRFTLDGLKAFGLFFVCFSRKNCQFGLANLFPVREFEDQDLADFVTILHTFQDFRNRAAHEGFHPDASNNLDAIWIDTVKLVETMFRFRENLLLSDSNPSQRETKAKVAVSHRIA